MILLLLLCFNIQYSILEGGELGKCKWLPRRTEKCLRITIVIIIIIIDIVGVVMATCLLYTSDAADE